MPELKTVVYARPGIDIALDYVLPSSASSSNKAPILLWFHGGGLLQGSRKVTPPHLQAAPEKHGLCVVSADYRLAPQTRLPAILEDIKACLEYLRSPAFASAANDSVNQSKIVVSGGSAGGWLALMLASGVGFEACRLTPPAHPLGCAAIYPITDITDKFFTTPQHPVSYMDSEVDEVDVLPFLDRSAPQVSFSYPESPRSQMYHYMVQEAIEQKLLLDDQGVSPASFRIAPAIGSGKFVLPPTFITHGSLDDKVPPRQSEEVAHACEAVGLPVQFELIEGADHLFDFDSGVTMDSMYQFIKSLL